MIQRFLILALILNFLDADSHYEDDESPRRSFPVSEDLEFEPYNPLNKEKEKTVVEKNINCEEFSRYALNCTVAAALLYKSSRKAPPMPAKMSDWCRALRHLTNCAIDWNSECREVTESHFNPESIKGHMHVISNICDDDWFLSRYDDLSICIEATADIWESCYTTFRLLVDEQKNKSSEWTHYDTHFYLCCARAAFRRCTLDSLFDIQKCTQEQASTLQIFSTIVSMGDVHQNCDSNMVYSNCPGGDPRPSKRQLSKLVTLDSYSSDALKLNIILFYLYCFYIFANF